MTYKDTPRSRWESNAVAIIESLPRPTFQAWRAKEQMMGTETDTPVVADIPAPTLEGQVNSSAYHLRPESLSLRIAGNYTDLDKRIIELEEKLDKALTQIRQLAGTVEDLEMTAITNINIRAEIKAKAKKQAKKIKKLERKLAKLEAAKAPLADVWSAPIPLSEAFRIDSVMGQLRALITDQNVQYIAQKLPSELLLYIDTEMCIDASDADGNAYQSVLKPVIKETVEIPF